MEWMEGRCHRAFTLICMQMSREKEIGFSRYLAENFFFLLQHCEDRRAILALWDDGYIRLICYIYIYFNTN